MGILRGFVDLSMPLWWGCPDRKARAAPPHSGGRVIVPSQRCERQIPVYSVHLCAEADQRRVLEERADPLGHDPYGMRGTR